MTEDELKELYKRASEERDESTNNILNSKSEKIVIISGPGTGKTYLFTQIIKKKGGKALTLTFINALVDDLSLGLFGLSDVMTLHGFSIGFLKNKVGAEIFPKLPDVIKRDASILIGREDINFENIFQGDEGEKDIVDFYKKRKDYYGRYYGFSDSIYGLVKYLEKHKDEIPKYDQILVDEFQDFNKIEVSLIDLLSEKNPIVIAGDDDQSLYTELKGADPKHIRDRHGKTFPDYEGFSLPFCLRSTRVIVEAINDLIKSAQKEGLLKDRIPKPYKYFPSKEKDKESSENEKIIYSQRFDTQLPTFIQKQIAAIATKERKPFSVLVIVPPQLKKYAIPKLAAALKKKGFHNVSSPSDPIDKNPNWSDGLGILVRNEKSNLGWRIIAELILPKDEFVELIKESKDGDKNIIDLLKNEIKEKVAPMITTFKSICDGEEIGDKQIADFFKEIRYQPHEAIYKNLQKDLREGMAPDYGSPRGIKDIPITLTTITSSKGLSADYVFITHFDDAYYIQDAKAGMSDNDTFKFLVALTRAKKKAFLVSSQEKEPTFLNWIDKSRIEKFLFS